MDFYIVGYILVSFVSASIGASIMAVLQSGKECEVNDLQAEITRLGKTIEMLDKKAKEAKK
jgi:hypothetical protein